MIEIAHSLSARESVMFHYCLEEKTELRLLEERYAQELLALTEDYFDATTLNCYCPFWLPNEKLLADTRIKKTPRFHH